jgi:predicted transcriptional regulator
MAKKSRTITIDKELSDKLDKICVRHGDVTWHIEQALLQYKPIREQK